jgi:hypothetical protein
MMNGSACCNWIASKSKTKMGPGPGELFIEWCSRGTVFPRIIMAEYESDQVHCFATTAKVGVMCRRASDAIRTELKVITRT